MRRLYALPTSLVWRIQLFQRDNGLASETEAARRLLEEALPLHDTISDVFYRFDQRLEFHRGDRHEAAKEVLVGHPKITWLKFEGDTISFEMGGHELKLLADGSELIDGKELDRDR